METPEKRTYRAKCHCGAIRFELRDGPITQGIRCNCSLCIRRGAVLSAKYYGPEDFTLISTGDALRVYQWGDLMMNHYFCNTCGVFPFSDVIETPTRYRVNLGCVDEIDPLSLEIDVVDGRSM